MDGGTKRAVDERGPAGQEDGEEEFGSRETVGRKERLRRQSGPADGNARARPEFARGGRVGRLVDRDAAAGEIAAGEARERASAASNSNCFLWDAAFVVT